MAFRIYRCHNCDHRMRLGARTCGKCWVSTPLHNRMWFCAGLTLVAAAGLAGLVTR